MRTARFHDCPGCARVPVVGPCPECGPYVYRPPTRAQAVATLQQCARAQRLRLAALSYTYQAPLSEICPAGVAALRQTLRTLRAWPGPPLPGERCRDCSAPSGSDWLCGPCDRDYYDERDDGRTPGED